MARTSSGKPAYQGASRSYDEIKDIRVSVVGSLLARYGTRDAYDQRFVNGFFDIIKNPETGKTHAWFVKRPGYAAGPLSFQPPGNSAIARGVTYWNGFIYSVFTDKIYRTNVSTFVTTDMGVTLTTTTGKCGFATTRAGAGTQYLGVNDGAKLYIISAVNVVTTITVNFPNPNTRDLVYMDGYWFTMKASDGTIHQCDLDDPTSWDSSKFITAQQYEGPGVGLAHQNNILIAFQDKSIAMFYDGGNSAGSILTLYEQAVQQIGCVAQASIVSDERYVMWVGNANNGGYTVYQLDGVGGLKLVSTPAVERILNTGISGGVSYCNAFSLRIAGKFFYILQIGNPGDSGTSRTLVYDYVENLWTEWKDPTRNDQWPIFDVTAIDVSLAPASNPVWVQHSNNGFVYVMSPLTYTDIGTAIDVLWQTAPLDFDTMLRKYYKSIELVCDQQSSSSFSEIYYTDDGGQTFSDPRIFDLSKPHPRSTNLGNSRRRSWSVTSNSNTPFRIEALEFKIRLGQS